MWLFLYGQQANLIFLLFDSHELDISNELKGAIDVVKGHEDKVCCILTKADQVNCQQLMQGMQNLFMVHWLHEW